MTHAPLLREDPVIASSLLYLSRQDPVLAGLNVQIGTINWTRFRPGFAGLVRIVLGQQISAKIADQLWFKLANHAGGEAQVTPTWIAEQNSEALKAFGFSQQKTRYAKTLAHAIQSGVFCDLAIDQMSDTALNKAITSQLGFGLWSAQMYALFCLARPDILPKGDLVFDRAVMALFKLKDRPDYKTLQKLCQPWQGHYTALTLLLWKSNTA